MKISAILELKESIKQKQQEICLEQQKLNLAESQFVEEIHQRFGNLPEDLVVRVEGEMVLVRVNVEDGKIASISRVPQL